MKVQPVHAVHVRSPDQPTTNIDRDRFERERPEMARALKELRVRQEQPTWKLSNVMLGAIMRVLADGPGDKQLRAAGFSDQLITTDVGKVHVCRRDHADSTNVYIFVAGLTSRASDYAPLLTLLAQSGSVAAIHPLGHGKSDDLSDTLGPKGMSGPNKVYLATSQTVTQLLDQYRGRSVFLLGHSMGGYQSVRYALEDDRARRLAGLIPICPAGAPVDEAGLRQLLENFAYAKSVPPPGPEGILAGLRRKLVAQLVSSRLTPHLAELMAALEPQDFLAPLHFKNPLPPTLFIWGSGDQVLKSDWDTFWTPNLPQGVERKILNADHGAPMTHANEIVEALRIFALSIPLKSHL